MKSPWKSGYGFPILIVLIVSMFIALTNTASQSPTIMALILVFFGAFATLGIANWITEKQVNRKLDWLEYIEPFESKFNSIDDVSDPLVSLHYNGTYVSRHNDDIYTAGLDPIIFGVSLYIFRNSSDLKKNFCVVYNKNGLAGLKFKAYKRL